MPSCEIHMAMSRDEAIAWAEQNPGDISLFYQREFQTDTVVCFTTATYLKDGLRLSDKVVTTGFVGGSGYLCEITIAGSLKEACDMIARITARPLAS